MDDWMDDLDVDEVLEMLTASGVGPEELVADMVEEFGDRIRDLDDNEFVHWAMEHYDL